MLCFGGLVYQACFNRLSSVKTPRHKMVGTRSQNYKIALKFKTADSLRAHTMKLLTFLILTSILGSSQFASASIIGTDSVDGVNSLYSQDWGHAYNTGSGNEFNALGRGNSARAFEAVTGSAYGFASGDKLQINASSCVVDNGQSCTESDYTGGDFRNLPVYALIGLWSTEAAKIVALDLSQGNPAFFIGSMLELIVPDFSSSLYLFMATNDGDFEDNSGAYSVRIDNISQVSTPSTTSQVPTPPAIYLLLIGLVLGRRFVSKRA